MRVKKDKYLSFRKRFLNDRDCHRKGLSNEMFKNREALIKLAFLIMNTSNRLDSADEIVFTNSISKIMVGSQIAYDVYQVDQSMLNLLGMFISREFGEQMMCTDKEGYRHRYLIIMNRIFIGMRLNTKNCQKFEELLSSC